MKSITVAERSGNIYTHTDDSIVSQKILEFCTSASALYVGLEMLLLLPVENDIAQENEKQLDVVRVFSPETKIYLTNRSIPFRFPGFKLNAISFLIETLNEHDTYYYSSCYTSFPRLGCDSKSNGTNFVVDVVHLATLDYYLDVSLVHYGLKHVVNQSGVYSCHDACCSGMDSRCGDSGFTHLLANSKSLCKSVEHHQVECCVLRLIKNIVADSMLNVGVFPDVVSVIVELIGSGGNGGFHDGVMMQMTACSYIAVCGGIVGLNTLSIKACEIVTWYYYKHISKAKSKRCDLLESELGQEMKGSDPGLSLDIPAVVVAHLPCLVIVTGLEEYCLKKPIDSHYSGEGEIENKMVALYCDAYKEFIRVLSEEVVSARCACPFPLGKQHCLCIVFSGMSADECSGPLKLSQICETERLFLAKIPLLLDSCVISLGLGGTILNPDKDQTRISRVAKDNTHISPVRWADIGGLAKVREEVMKTIEIPQIYPALFHLPADLDTSISSVNRRALTFSRNGILLYGPPGTGKTMVARAVATECGLEFISVKGPELLDMYVGESERNVRAVFQSARIAAPCVLFFDEMDSLCPQRSKTSDGGAVMDRVVSQLLTEMDNLVCSPEGNEKAVGAVRHVFVIGATNRPDLLDSALLRPGRFDKLIYLSVCDTAEQRLGILRAQTRNLRFACSNCDDVLTEVATSMPKMITGADISSVVSKAYSIALERTISTLGSHANSQGIHGNEALKKFVDECEQSQLLVELRVDDFAQALVHFKCSVSEADLQHYNTLHKIYCRKEHENDNDIY